MTLEDIISAVAVELVRKSGVREWDQPEAALQAIGYAARTIAIAAWNGPPPDEPDEEDDMALPDYMRLANATAITFQSSGGSYAITLASLANGSGRQSAKADLGASRKQMYRVKMDAEIAATPTAGATIDLYWAPSTSGTAGTDNPGGIGGTDSAYAGYSSNLTAALKQLIFIGSMVTTTQATATVQKGFVGTFVPPTRYGTLVVVNNSGAALHSSDSNMNVTFIPEEIVAEDT